VASVTLKVGNGTLVLNESSDLARLATGSIDLGILGNALNFEAMLDQPVSQISTFSVQPQIEVSRDGAWTAAGQAEALTLSFKAGITGTLSLVQPGAELFKFPADVDGNPGPSQTAQRGGVHCPFLCIGLKVSYSIKGGAAFSFGSLGVSGSGSGGQVFEIKNYFACSPDMVLRKAIESAFNAFVLPFNPAGAASMPDGAFLDYTFAGNIAFDASLTYGFSIAGASLGEIKRSFNSPLATGGIAPTIKFGASLGLTFQANDAYRLIVGRQNSAGKNLLSFCVSKADKTALGINFGVTFTASLGAKFNLQNAIDKVIEKAAAPILKDLPGNLKNEALASFKQSLGEKQLEKFRTEAQDEINDLLKKVNNQTATFTVAYERDHKNTQLCSYVFDCNVPESLAVGYAAAARCDLTTALQANGVELLPGSFLQDELSSATTLTLQFFNLFKAVDKTTFTKKLKTLYVGKGVFRVVYDVGVDWINIFNNKSEELKVFFEASADTLDSATFQNANITLNFLMVDSEDTKRASLTAIVLEALGDDTLKSLASRITDTVTITARVDAHAFGALRFDPIKIGNRLNSGPHDNDRQNYETFAAMVNALRGEPPFGRGFNTYLDWVTYNQRANDQEGSTIPPDRDHSGNPRTDSIWPRRFANISDLAEREFIRLDFEAGRQFMNFCEFLDRLDDSTLDEPSTSETFQKLLNSLAKVVHNDSLALTWNGRASFLALFHLLSARVANVQGSEPGKPLNISFELRNNAVFSAAGSREN
jgi:hypothetical protein